MPTGFASLHIAATLGQLSGFTARDYQAGALPSLRPNADNSAKLSRAVRASARTNLTSAPSFAPLTLLAILSSKSRSCWTTFSSIIASFLGGFDKSNLSAVIAACDAIVAQYPTPSRFATF